MLPTAHFHAQNEKTGKRRMKKQKKPSKGLQGGEDVLDALSCKSLFAKEPVIIGLFCRK